jgi:uncharacterized repeat protein (TIGR01451 family)
MKKLLFSLFILGALGVFSTKAYADCQAVYGGGQTCTSNNFTINKYVQVPGKGGGNYVPTLLNTAATYSPSQTIKYELIVTNTGNSIIPTLNITDNFPQYVNFVSGAGSYDANSKTLTFTISNLGAGQNQKIDLTAQTADSKTLPVGMTCVINQANATDTNGANSFSSSQACIQNTTAVLPAVTVKTTPATGPEMIPLALLFPGALGGIFLRRKSNKKLINEGGEK